MSITRSFTFWDGHGRATYGEPDVLIGDRIVPREIHVEIRGGRTEPDYSLKIEVRKGIPQWTGVEIRSRSDGPEIRDKDLRSIPLEQWLEQIVGECSEVVARSPSGKVVGSYKLVTDHLAQRDIRRNRAQRRHISDELLQTVATVYRDNFDKPTVAVMRTFGVSERTATRYVRQARDAGYLPRTTPGKKRA